MPRGGFRPGAGRPKGAGKRGAAPAAKKEAKPAAEKPAKLPLNHQTPLEYLLAVMNDPDADTFRRDRAAAVAASFVHPRATGDGKKAGRQAAAAVAGKGKFAPSAPPKLVVNNR